MISAFLNHLEDERGNSTRTRNVRLTAVRSLFSYAALQHPEHALLIQQVLDIPPKRFDKRTVTFLTSQERDALLAAPDPKRWEGRRDKAMLALAVQTGLRVSELTSLNCVDITLGDGAAVRCEGKGRKQRTVPLDRPVQNLLRLLARTNALATAATRCSAPAPDGASAATPSRNGSSTHAKTAARTCPSLLDKSIHPHVLRHSCAMSLLQAGVDTTVIALWLGHAGVRSTDAYVHADMTIKEKALALTTPATAQPGRYGPATRSSRSSTACDYAETLGVEQLICPPRRRPEHSRSWSQPPAVSHSSTSDGSTATRTFGRSSAMPRRWPPWSVAWLTRFETSRSPQSAGSSPGGSFWAPLQPLSSVSGLSRSGKVTAFSRETRSHA